MCHYFTKNTASFEMSSQRFSLTKKATVKGVKCGSEIITTETNTNDWVGLYNMVCDQREAESSIRLKIHLLSSLRQTLSAASGMLAPWTFLSKAEVSSPSSSSSSPSRLNCRPGNTPPLRTVNTWTEETQTGEQAYKYRHCWKESEEYKSLLPSSHCQNLFSWFSAAVLAPQSVWSTWAEPS